MEHNKTVEKLNKALNLLESVRLELLREEKPAKKKKTDPVKEIKKGLEEMSDLNRQLTVRQILEKYGQPTDEEHVASVDNVVQTNGITLEQLDSCIERVKIANDREPKNDIKRYTYSCLHKINKA